METEKIEAKIISLALVSIIIVELITGKVMGSATRDLYYLIQGAARVIDIVLIVLIVVLWGKGLSSIGLEKSGIRKGIIKGLMWSAGFGVVAAIGFLILHLCGINPFKLFQGNLPTKPLDIIFWFIIAGVIGPVAEELLFRGVLYGFFRRWGVLTALVVTTIIFVLLHSPSGIPVPQLVGGVVFAIAYEIEKSLMVPIIIHILGNSAIFALSFIKL
jgi:membrane protease YdiL (CAAX protease family)